MTPRIYTSSEVALATSTVVIVEFTLACKNDVMGINLYAALNGKTIPAVKTKDGAYQVSLVEVREKKKTTTMTTETTTQTTTKTKFKLSSTHTRLSSTHPSLPP